MALTLRFAPGTPSPRFGRGGRGGGPVTDDLDITKGNVKVIETE